MTDPEEHTPAVQRRVKKKSPVMIIVGALLLITLLGVLFLFYPQIFRAILPGTTDQTTITTPGQISDTPSKTTPSGQDEPLESSTQQHSEQQSTPADSTKTGLPTIKPLQSSADEATQGSDLSAPAQPADSCTQRTERIGAFFDALDSKEYLKPFQLPQKSRIYFPQLIQKLIDNPPIVTGETDDLFTILQNTAHFFRVLGKDNILILKGILDREKDTFEGVLADFYQLLDAPDCLKQGFSLAVGADPLYRYAGFFLNTMGGRLYLFRRDSMSRMVVSYYSILVIDRANREGRNKYGIELKPAIDSLIDEIDASSIDLKLRGEYLENLYRLQERYQ